MERLTEQQAMIELGFTPQLVRQLRTLPFPQAQARLVELKAEAKKLLRQASFKYHPDRNQGDEAVATANFTLLREVAKKLEQAKLQRAMPAPQMVRISMGPFPFPAHVQFRVQPGVGTTNTTTSTSTVYGRAWDAMNSTTARAASNPTEYVARRAVNVKPR